MTLDTISAVQLLILTAWSLPALYILAIQAHKQIKKGRK